MKIELNHLKIEEGVELTDSGNIVRINDFDRDDVTIRIGNVIVQIGENKDMEGNDRPIIDIYPYNREKNFSFLLNANS